MKARQIIFILMLLLVSTGCFHLREPEKPDAAGEWIIPTQPSILVQNLIASIKFSNPVIYERCFSGYDFFFEPDPITKGNSNNIFSNWSINDEREYMVNLKKRTSLGNQNTMELGNSKELFFSTDSLEYSTSYKLFINHQDTSYKFKDFEGTLRFIMKRTNNEWKIKNWQDSRISNKPCWSDFKKHFITL